MKRYPPAQDETAAYVHHEPGSTRPAPRRPAAQAPGTGTDSDGKIAASCYLGVIFFSFLPALIVYLTRGRTSPYLRYHAAQAANLAFTLLLFDLSALMRNPRLRARMAALQQPEAVTPDFADQVADARRREVFLHENAEILEIRLRQNEFDGVAFKIV